MAKQNKRFRKNLKKYYTSRAGKGPVTKKPDYVKVDGKYTSKSKYNQLVRQGIIETAQKRETKTGEIKLLAYTKQYIKNAKAFTKTGKLTKFGKNLIEQLVKKDGGLADYYTDTIKDRELYKDRTTTINSLKSKLAESPFEKMLINLGIDPDDTQAIKDKFGDIPQIQLEDPENWIDGYFIGSIGDKEVVYEFLFDYNAGSLLTQTDKSADEARKEAAEIKAQRLARLRRG